MRRRAAIFTSILGMVIACPVVVAGASSDSAGPTTAPATNPSDITASDTPSRTPRRTRHGVESHANLVDVRLADVIDLLRDATGANINVAWRALESAGVTRDTTITINLRGLTMRKALNLILRNATGDKKLAWYVDQNVIEITTQELADAKMVTRVYPVEDLIMEIPNFTAPDFDLSNASNQSASSGSGNSNSGGGNNAGLFASNSNSPAKDQVANKKDRADQLIQLIMDSIRPEIWQPNGGKASIRFFNGNLIITAPRSVQAAIGG